MNSLTLVTFLTLTSQALLLQVPVAVTTQIPKYSTVNLLPDVTRYDLKKKFEDKNVVLLDVRTKEEFKAGHVAGFVNIELYFLGDIFNLDPEEFKNEVGITKPALNDEIILMCLHGIRARTAQLALMGYGYENVRIYKGSFTDWSEANEEITYPDKK